MDNSTITKPLYRSKPRTNLGIDNIITPNLEILNSNIRTTFTMPFYFNTI